MFTFEMHESIVEVSKSQQVRLLDVFAIGPAMIYAGSAKSGLPESVKLLLLLSGIGTVMYNGANYVENKKRIYNLNNPLEPML